MDENDVEEDDDVDQYEHLLIANNLEQQNELDVLNITDIEPAELINDV